MKHYIFRNNTIEAFFPECNYTFSGYDDISFIPQDTDGYIWFYQVPIKFDSQTLAEEIQGFGDKLQLVASQIPGNKTLIVLTLEKIWSIKYTTGDFAVRDAISKFNYIAEELASFHQNIKIIDFGQFCRQYAASELIDWKIYFISQMELNLRLASKFKKWWNEQLKSIALKRKKCLVLDLDNTLWGGILGEDGIEGIKIGGDYPGKAFLYFQGGLKQLARNGVILTVCSKNNEADVLQAWEKNPYIVLKKENFAAWRINWQDKASNIAELAQELNIGLDSMVFIDDNPTERELVRQMLPMVEVPDFPDQPYMLPDYLKKLVEHYFTVYSLTREDLAKTEQYKANAARAAEKSHFTNMEDYLKSLEIKISIIAVNEFNISRIAQMTQKTNQFNLTTHRLEESEIRDMTAKGWKIWCISVADRFGDNGITGAVFVSNSGHIDNLLLSCRILGKGIETAFMQKVLEMLKPEFKTITARYIPSAKNSLVSEFYERIGMKISGTEDGVKSYVMSTEDINPQIKKYYSITVK